MPQTDDFTVPGHHDLQHVIAIHMLSCSGGTVIDPVNISIAGNNGSHTICLFPDCRMVFPIDLALILIVIHILHHSRETLRYSLLILPIHVCLEYLTVPLSAGCFFHITAVIDLVIHNTVTLYTIGFLDNPRIPSILLHIHRCIRTASSQIVCFAVNGQLSMFYIFDQAVFLDPVDTVPNIHTVSAFSHSRIAHLIHQITAVILNDHRIPGFTGCHFRTRGGGKDLPSLGIINNIIQDQIPFYVLCNQLLCIPSRHHAEQFITKSLLSLTEM